MPNNDVKIDHEAAKKWAKRMLTPEGLTEEEINLSRAYLDAMAQRDEAEKERDEAKALLREIEGPLARCDGELSAIHHRGTVDRDNCKAFSERARELGVKLTSFLAKHRKTGASDGK